MKYYTYMRINDDYLSGKKFCPAAWVNVTDQHLFISTLQGRFEGLVEHQDYVRVEQPSKIATHGNKAKRWLTLALKHHDLRRYKKHQEMQKRFGGLMFPKDVE